MALAGRPLIVQAVKQFKIIQRELRGQFFAVSESSNVTLGPFPSQAAAAAAVQNAYRSQGTPRSPVPLTNNDTPPQRLGFFTFERGSS